MLGPPWLDSHRFRDTAHIHGNLRLGQVLSGDVSVKVLDYFEWEHRMMMPDHALIKLPDTRTM